MLCLRLPSPFTLPVETIEVFPFSPPSLVCHVPNKDSLPPFVICEKAFFAFMLHYSSLYSLLLVFRDSDPSFSFFPVTAKKTFGPSFSVPAPQREPPRNRRFLLSLFYFFFSSSAFGIM